MVTVIITCGSNHHLISALSYIESLKSDVIFDKFIILTDGFHGKKYNPDSGFLEKIRNLYQVQVIVFDFEKGLSSLELSFSENLVSVVYITPRFFSINIYLRLLIIIKRSKFSMNFRWIESEEGIGSYATLFYRVNDYRINKDYKNIIKTIINNIVGEFVIKTKVRLISSNIGSNNKTINSVRNLYELLYKEKYTFEKIDNKFFGIMLFASTTAVEENWLKKEEYLNFIEKIRLHAENRNLILLIKPHPSEDTSKYPQSLIYNSLSEVFEKILINDDRIKAVASICSTVLYTSKIITNIETYIYVNESLNKRFYVKDNEHLMNLKNNASHFVVL